MRITVTHPLGRDVKVLLDGEPLADCLMADDREGVALVQCRDRDGKVCWNDEQQEPMTATLHGAVRFVPLPGKEDRLNWYLSGFVEGYETAQREGDATAMSEEPRAFRVRAWQTDEEFGNDRWKADQYSLGRGTHDAVLVLCRPGETPEDLLEQLGRERERERR